MAQKSYKKLMELYGGGTSGAAVQPTGATQGTGAVQTTGATQGTGTAQTGTAQQQSNAMLELILNRQPYSYDPGTDPAAAAIRKETARNARAVTQDTMGQYAGLTGGVPSTAAVSAAAQAGNQAMAQGADRIADLEQLAWQRHQSEGQQMNSMLALLQQQAADEYNRGRDALADQRYADELAYNREQTEYEKQLAMAQLQAAYGDLSGLKALGVDTSKYVAGGGGGGGYRYSNQNTNDDPEPGPGDDEGYNSLLMAYPSMTMSESEWAAAAAQYGESNLIAWGFSKRASSGTKPGSGGGRPGSGNDRVNMLN